MSWLSVAGSFLFGGSKTSDKVLDGGMSALDKMFHTDEEKADGKREMMKLYIDYQKATAPQNVARRLIALIVTSVWATLVTTAGILHVSGNTDEAAYLLKLLGDGGVSMAFMVVIGFYFAKRMMGGVKKDG